VTVHDFAVGPLQYRVRVAQRDSRWVAVAEVAETGERFGAECSGSSEAEAIERLREWLTWQHQHESALEALQFAERTYHKLLAASAFVSPGEGGTSLEAKRESLDAVEQARRDLDEVRARRPS
jgi:hypothetical protein